MRYQAFHYLSRLGRKINHKLSIMTSFDVIKATFIRDGFCNHLPIRMIFIQILIVKQFSPYTFFLPELALNLT